MTASFPCPRCSITLFRGKRPGFELWGCGTCGGVWLDLASARRLAEALPADAVALASQVARHASRSVEGSLAAGACPECEREMTHQSIAGAHVVIDVCGAHGAWYDKDELEKIAESIGRAKTAWAPAASEVAPGPKVDDGESLEWERPPPQDPTTGEKIVGGTLGVICSLILGGEISFGDD